MDSVYSINRHCVVNLVKHRLPEWTANCTFLTVADLVHKATTELKFEFPTKELMECRKQVQQMVRKQIEKTDRKLVQSMIPIYPVFEGNQTRKSTGYCYVPNGQLLAVRAANIALVKSGGVQCLS